MTYEDRLIAIRLQAVVRVWREFIEEIQTCEPETLDAIEKTHEAMQDVIHAKEPWALPQIAVTPSPPDVKPRSV